VSDTQPPIDRLAHDVVETGQVNDPQTAIDRIVREFVDRTAHVRAAVLGSADGHPLASHLGDVDTEPPTVAAMSAAMSALATQLARTASDAVTANVHLHATETQIWVLDAGHAATFTVMAAAHGDPTSIAAAAQHTVTRLIEALAADG
jgi:predicted regulator of Ras-like GTPase activity (Roadblock/LC7/MglB family)